MRWAAVLLAVSGCNAAFGLRETRELDAQQFDAPLDAPYQCPPSGTLLRFSHQVHQVSDQPCSSYTESTVTGLAVAECVDGLVVRISQRPIGGVFSPIPELPAATSDFDFGNPRLSVEGDLLLVQTFDLTATVSAVRVYHRQSSGSWLRGDDLPVPQYGVVGSPSSGPKHHVLYAVSNDLLEFVDDGTGTWTQMPTHMGATLGLTVPRITWLSPDGLRVLISGSRPATPNTIEIMEADRMAITDPFGVAITLEVPGILDPFVSADCSRLYMSSLHAIFYEIQI
ncbi:MAG: hypothetical protein JWO36_5808 [Myxococcales bacterium]|nr:hypothetical protein [Myxococcales bacterium]